MMAAASKALEPRKLPQNDSSTVSVKMVVIKQCVTCCCWLSHKVDGVTMQNGECRRFPKQAVTNSLGCVVWQFPWTLHTDWCEEHRPKT